MMLTNSENQPLAHALLAHIEVVRGLESQLGTIETIAEKMVQSIEMGKTVFWCGNGGSAADSQHLAAELVGRFSRDRKGVASVALTTDSSVITAIANDYGYENVFRRQVEALVRPGDVLVGISTSGNSPNVCRALELAASLGALTVAFTGVTGGAMTGIAAFSVRVASRETARIQEAHILCGHMICDYIEHHISRPAALAASTGPEI